MPGRKYGVPERYGFNTQERSTEINENSYTAEFWQYDSRIGRRWNIDPVPKSMVSPYMVLGCNPILYVDPLGNDWYKNRKSGQMDWFDGSSRRKGYKHMGVNFREKTDIKGVTVWYGNSKDQEWQQKELSEVVVTGKAKPKSLMDQSPTWQAFNNSLKEASQWNDGLTTYNNRLRLGQSLVQNGDDYYYLDHIGSYQRNVQAEKDWRAMSLGAVGIYTLPFALMGATESGATYYLYQGGNWIVRKYGMSFLKEVAKEGIANRGNLAKMDWSDIFVSTALSKWKSAGANGVAEFINATTDLSGKDGFQSSFLIGTKYEKSVRQTGSDLFFGGLKIKYTGIFQQMGIDQIRYQVDLVFPK